MATFAFREIYWGSLHGFYGRLASPELASRVEQADTMLAFGIFAASLLALRRARFAVCISGIATILLLTGAVAGSPESGSFARVYVANVGLGGFSFVLLLAVFVADLVNKKRQKNSSLEAVAD